MFVIAGTSQSGTAHSGVVLTSADGITWDTAAEVEQADFQRLALLPDGLAILGTTVERRRKGRAPTREATLFTSTDATHWETHRLPAAGATVARSDAGVSLVSSATAWRDQVLWRSEDGDTWTPIDLPVLPGTEGFVRASALAWAPSGFVLALSRDDGRYPAGSLWHSTDGLSWDRVADTDGIVTAIIANDRSIVAFPGTGDPYLPHEEWIRVLRSTDGRVWAKDAGLDRSVDDATITADGRVLAMVAGQGRAPVGSYIAVVFGDPS
jgi:hypothetical protein